MKTTIPIGERVKRFLARHGGNAEAAVTELLTDNLRQRDRLRAAQSDTPYKADARVAELEGESAQLEREVDRLSGLVPAQGAVVLSADDAKVWVLYQGLGKPEDVKKSLDELPALRTTVSDAERGTAATAAAKLLGWNGEATAGAVRDKGLVVSFVDGKDTAGKDVKVPHVRPASDEKAATVPLTEWVQKHAAYLTPALAATSAVAATQSQSTSVTTFPVQSGGGAPPSTGDPVAEHMKRSQDARNARPSPFAPRKAAVTT